MSEDFNQQLLQNMPRMRVHALALTRNHADADDLVQTTAVLALRAQTQFMPGTNFAAWTGRILRNRFISDCRENKRRPVAIDEMPERLLASPDNFHNHILAREAIRAMSTLTPPLKNALGLACSEHSYDEMGAALSCSVGTVKSRIWRARRKMEALLSHENDGGPGSRAARSTWATPAPARLN